MGTVRAGVRAAILASAVGGLAAAPAVAAAPRSSVGTVPRLPAAARVTGPAPSGHRVALTLSLASRDPLGMARMATAVSTPGSPLYRHYLTVAQFARRFGAAPARVAAVRDALRAEGLHVSRVQANRLTLEASGTAATVQRAFATRLADVRLADGRRAFADRRTPTLPAAIAPDVEAVVGLSTLVAPAALGVRHAPPAPEPPTARSPRATGHVATGGPQPCGSAQVAGASQSGYTADQIAAAYDFSGLYGAGDLAAGQTIAVYELETLRRSDIAAYQGCYGTAVPVRYIRVGHPQPSPTDEESALDVEQLIALAPGARIDVFEAPDSAAGSVAGYARIVSQDRARTVSTSWGACESKITLGRSDLSIVRSESRLFAEAALQGQSILAASGDTGSAGCWANTAGTGLAVQDPASQPQVTGVGGTTLFTPGPTGPTLWNPAAPAGPPMQSVWNDGRILVASGRQPAATGGGISTLWAMPGYQRRGRALGVINADSSGRPCRSSRDCREVPDVSASGDPAFGYVVHVTGPSPADPTRNVGQWTVEGGTSAAAPVWAALTAEANALSSCRGAALGFENPSLYALAARPGGGGLQDITAPSPVTGAAGNDALGTNHGLYPVTPGYDMTTGLGTPNAAAIALGLCALRAPVYTVSVAAPRHAVAIVHARFRFRLRATDSGRLRLTFHARGLPRGLRISRRGVISGRARRLGARRVTVTASDHATNRATVRFRLAVLDSPAALARVSLTGVARRRPRLAFTVTQGRYAPGVRSIAVRLPRGLSFGSVPARPRGVRVTAGRRRVRFHVRARGRAGTITLRSPQRRVRVTIARPRLFVSRGLARTARRHRSRARVRIRISVTDRHRRTTRRSDRLRL